MAAIDFLKTLTTHGKIVLDLDGSIQSEYRGNLSPSGEPGVGDRFYQVILSSAPSRVERVELPIEPSTGEFLDFPNDPALADFDRSDRKFAAAAKRSGAPVAHALDSGWLEHRPALCANGIAVESICGDDPSTWFEDDEPPASGA